MVITREQIEQVFNTLPVSYYLKRDIPISLTDGPDSYFDPIHDNIVVSAKSIIDMFAKMPAEFASKVDIETATRSIHYHEISHVLLTPTHLYDYADHNYSEVLNIFEDERIETVFKDYYIGVNFKQNIALLNGYTGEAPKNGHDAFYQAVRYRVGKKEYLDRVNEIIKTYACINASYDKGGYYKQRKIELYVNAVVSLYNDILKDWKENPKDYQNKQNNRGGQGNGQNGQPGQPSSTGQGGADSLSSSAGSDDIDSKIASIIDSISNTGDDVVISDVTKIIDNALEDVLEEYHDPKLIAQLNDIILRKKKKRGNASAAINSYAGKMNIKSVGTRDDYRWWYVQNREGNMRRFSAVHFTLYIDKSGSFMSNEKNVNILLRALEAIKDKDFSFDVVTLDTDITEWPDTHKKFKTGGSNAIPDKLKDVVARHTIRNANNYNIVLFDGDCHCADISRVHAHDNLEYFDGPNTIIVSDKENMKYFDRCISTAQIIYTTDYCTEFINNILKLLDRVM